MAVPLLEIPPLTHVAPHEWYLAATTEVFTSYVGQVPLGAVSTTCALETQWALLFGTLTKSSNHANWVAGMLLHSLTVCKNMHCLTGTHYPTKSPSSTLSRFHTLRVRGVRCGPAWVVFSHLTDVFL